MLMVYDNVFDSIECLKMQQHWNLNPWSLNKRLTETYSSLKVFLYFVTQVTTKGAGLNPNAKVWQEIPVPQSQVPEDGTEGTHWLETTPTSADVTEGKCQSQCTAGVFISLHAHTGLTRSSSQTKIRSSLCLLNGIDAHFLRNSTCVKHVV